LGGQERQNNSNRLMGRDGLEIDQDTQIGYRKSGAGASNPANLEGEKK
jgi:hypothetical protein